MHIEVTRTDNQQPIIIAQVERFEIDQNYNKTQIRIVARLQDVCYSWIFDCVSFRATTWGYIYQGISVGSRQDITISWFR